MNDKNYVATLNDLAPASTDDELTTLRKSYAAVLDQKRALLQEVEALRAEIAYLQAAAR